MKTISRILVIVLFMITLQCSLSSGQVVIKSSTAEYFLEADDERFLLRKQDSVNTRIINNLKEEIAKDVAIIGTYKADEITRVAEENILIDEHNAMIEDLEDYEKQIRKQKRVVAVSAGAAAGAVIGSAVGQPIIGAVLGGGVGYVVNLFKRKHDKPLPDGLQ